MWGCFFCLFRGRAPNSHLDDQSQSSSPVSPPLVGLQLSIVCIGEQRTACSDSPSK